jgi:glycine cleavage system T protein
MTYKSPLHDVAAQAGAEFVDDTGWTMPGRFADTRAEYRAARERAALFDVSHRGKIEVTGADAVKFIQNLCSNDVARLLAGSGCEVFFTNMHAKVIAHALAYRVKADGGDTLWLDTVPGLGEKLVKHLDHYLISEEVTLADRTRELAQVYLAGPQAGSILNNTLPGDVRQLEPLQHLQNGALHIRRNDAQGAPGYDIVGPTDQAETFWGKLREAGAAPAGLQAYELLRVEAGTPAYDKDIDEVNIALEAGRTKQAISYTKGCFLGQEPLVRIRDLGHVNRVLLGLTTRAPEALSKGARVFREGKGVGQVTSSVVSPRHGAAIALAYLRRGSQDPGTVVEVETAGGRATAEVSCLPFSFSGAAVP